MKIFLIAILLAPILAFSQNNKARLVAISVEKNNYLYFGMDNPVSILVSGFKSEDVIVKIDNGTIIKEKNNRWIVNASKLGKANISVFVKDKRQDGYCGSMQFSVVRLPDPVAYFAGIKSGFIEKNNLTDSICLVANLEDFLFNGVGFKVCSFSFSILDTHSTKTVECIGNKLNNEALKLIQESKSGDRISFYHISVVGADGTLSYIKELNLTIK